MSGLSPANRDLIIALSEENYDGVKNAIDKGADVNLNIGTYGDTPLMFDFNDKNKEIFFYYTRKNKTHKRYR